MAWTKKKRLDFLAGGFATFTVFAVYYLRNHVTVEGAVREGGALTLVFGGLALSVVASAGGFWAWANTPVSAKAAFSIGLGVPAILFAVDLGTVASSDAAKSASALGFLEIDETTPLGRGLALILGPVNAVRRDAEEEATVRTEAEASRAIERIQAAGAAEIAHLKTQVQSTPAGAAVDPRIFEQATKNLQVKTGNAWNSPSRNRWIRVPLHD